MCIYELPMCFLLQLHYLRISSLCQASGGIWHKNGIFCGWYMSANLGQQNFQKSWWDQVSKFLPVTRQEDCHRLDVIADICDNAALTCFTDLAIFQCSVTICQLIVTGQPWPGCLWQDAVTDECSSLWFATKIGQYPKICPVFSLIFVTHQPLSCLLWQRFEKLSQRSHRTIDLWQSAWWLSEIILRWNL